jgi:hypothetical protein
MACVTIRYPLHHASLINPARLVILQPLVNQVRLVSDGQP